MSGSGNYLHVHIINKGRKKIHFNTKVLLTLDNGEVTKAIQQLRQGLYAQAFSILLEVQAEKEPAGCYALGLCYIHVKEFDIAISYFEKALRFINASTTLSKAPVENNKTYLKLFKKQIQERVYLMLVDTDFCDRFPRNVEQMIGLVLIYIYRKKGILEMFVRKGGIDFNTRDALDCTPLFYAAIKGNRDIVMILLHNGAGASVSNNDSVTPLHAVSKSGNKDIIKALIEAGAEINSTDKFGKTALMYTLEEKRTEVANYLISLSADTRIKDHDGHSAIDYATAHRLRDIIPQLSGIEEAKDSFGNTPLHQAIHNGQSEVVATLLKSGMVVDSLNDSGETPLILTCTRDNLQITKLLLHVWANPNLHLLDGNAPLHYAAERGNTFIGIALIEKGAEINAVDNLQHSALHYASERGYVEILEKLMMAGAEN